MGLTKKADADLHARRAEYRRNLAAAVVTLSAAEAAARVAEEKKTARSKADALYAKAAAGGAALGGMKLTDAWWAAALQFKVSRDEKDISSLNNSTRTRVTVTRCSV